MTCARCGIPMIGGPLCADCIDVLPPEMRGEWGEPVKGRDGRWVRAHPRECDVRGCDRMAADDRKFCHGHAGRWRRGLRGPDLEAPLKSRRAITRERTP